MNTFLLPDGANRGPGWTTIPNQEESGAEEVTNLHGGWSKGEREGKKGIEGEKRG